jgi:hypothetical protein
MTSEKLRWNQDGIIGKKVRREASLLLRVSFFGSTLLWKRREKLFV